MFNRNRVFYAGDSIRLSKAYTDTMKRVFRNSRGWGFQSERPLCTVLEADEHLIKVIGRGKDAGCIAWLPAERSSWYIE